MVDELLRERSSGNLRELMGDANIEYYQRRADEYDATSWQHPGADARDTERVRVLLILRPLLGVGGQKSICTASSGFCPPTGVLGANEPVHKS